MKISELTDLANLDVKSYQDRIEVVVYENHLTGEFIKRLTDIIVATVGVVKFPVMRYNMKDSFTITYYYGEK
jgi:hypothetical protein